MTQTARLRLPQVAAAQAQKHVTVNEALTMLDTLVHLSVIDKDLTSPPAAPQEGDAYIVAAGGSGAWTGWDDRIARFQDGVWRSFLPGTGGGAGWLAFVQDEDTVYVFDGSQWRGFTQGEPGVSGLRYRFDAATATGSDPGAGGLRMNAGSAGAASEIAISHIDDDAIAQGAFIGQWDAAASPGNRGHLQMRRPGVAGAFALLRVTGEAAHAGGWSRLPVAHVASTGGFSSGDTLDVVFRATGDKGVDGQSFAADAVVEDIPGRAAHDGEAAGFVVLVIDESAIYVKLSATAGDWSQPARLSGRDGIDAGLPWRFDADTASGEDPGAGRLRLDHADPAAAGEIALSAEAALPGGPDVASLLAAWGAVDNPVKGTLTASAQGAPGRFAEWRVTAVAMEGSYCRLALAGGVASGSFVPDETVVVRFAPAGMRGDLGPTGPNTGLDYAWSATTGGDPGSGRVAGDHASVPSVTTLAVSTFDRNGANTYAVIEAADDSSSQVRGHVRLVDTAERTNWAQFALVGEAEPRAGWYELPVVHVGSAGSFADGAVLAVDFARTGDAGAISGPQESVAGQPAFFASADGNALTQGDVAAPPAIDADTHDYAPAGLAGAVVLRLSSDAPRTLTGLSGGAGQREMTLFNAGDEPITLADEDGGSLAGNRFALGGRDMALRPEQSATLAYDATLQRWVARQVRPVAADIGLEAEVAGQSDVQAAMAALDPGIGAKDVTHAPAFDGQTGGDVLTAVMVAAGAVVAYGENADGRFWRFEAGLQICAHTMNLGSRTAGGSGTFSSPYRSSPAVWTFPAAFDDAPSISLYTMVPGADSVSARWAGIYSADEVTPTRANGFGWVGIGSNDSDLDVLASLTAIGRWKAAS